MKNAAVLHFGGVDLSIIVGHMGSGGNVVIEKRVTREYGGIVGTEFAGAQALAGTLASALREAVSGGKSKIDKLYIGVPGVFCDCTVKGTVLNFARPRRVDARDIREMFADVTLGDATRTVINKSAVWYKLDDGRPVISASGAVAKKVQAQISMISCMNSFINTVKNCLAGVPVRRIEFIASALAEPLYLIDEETRDKTCVLISTSMFATSVAVASGDGLIYLKSFDQGIAHAANDVSIVLDVDFEIARSLVNEAVISVKMREHDNYEITYEGKRMKFSADTVNDIIKSRMEVIAENIQRLLKSADPQIITNAPIFICGGYLDAVGGARDFLSHAVGAPITQCVDPYTKGNKEGENGVNALIRLALIQTDNI
jgi:cell division ATPase FtsA